MVAVGDDAGACGTHRGGHGWRDEGKERGGEGEEGFIGRLNELTTLSRRFMEWRWSVDADPISPRSAENVDLVQPPAASH